MAHKAKRKTKPDSTQGTKSDPKIKVASKKTKGTEKKTTATTAESENQNPPSCSFTEPIIRISPPIAEKRPGSPQKPQNKGNEADRTRLTIFHKRGKNDVNSDIIGAKALATWKKSSGRSKSWANCRRKKLSKGDLELLVMSQTRSVAFGWRASSTITPSCFLRSQGLTVNSEPKRKRSSTTRTSGYLPVEYDRSVPLPRGRPVWGWANRQGNEFRAGWGFLRMTIHQGIVSFTRERHLTEINIPSSFKVFGRQAYSNAEETSTFPVLRLLRNENHADVYLVQNPNAAFDLYHAHAFLKDGLSGNWPAFAKRKMKSLRGSRDWAFEVLQEGRMITVMKPKYEAQEFRLKMTQNDFPPLPGVGKISTLYRYCLQADVDYLDPKFAKPRPKKNIGRVSYAAVVGRKLPSKRPHASNHRAYKAWEDRKDRGKPKKPTNLKSDSIASIGKYKTSKLERKVEDLAGWVMVERSKLPSIARYSRIQWRQRLL